jgi:hypothetical protein
LPILGRARSQLSAARPTCCGGDQLQDRAGSSDHGLERGHERDEGSAQDGAKLLIGLAFGIAVGLALAYIIDAADDRIYSVQRFAAPPAAVIGKLPPLRARGCAGASVEEVGNLTREQARVIAARLAFARNASHAKTLLVTGQIPSAGAPAPSTWLAWGLAEIGNRVVLIDLDYAHGDAAAELLSLPVEWRASGVIERGGSFEKAGVLVACPGAEALT